jgi:tetratricopeptide (TPR) repeat protein
MDRRKSVVLAVGLAAGVLGCAHDANLLAVRQEQADVEAARDADQPKRTPRAATCVAFATFNERGANAANCTPEQREQLRAQALKEYERALKIEPTNLAAEMGVARLHAARGANEAALAAFQQAIKTHPQEGVCRFELGMFHARRKEWGPAVENLREAARLNPERRSYAHGLGYCLARAGKYDESFAVFAKLDGEAEAHYSVARMMQHTGQEELCKQHLQLALALKPDMAKARQLLTTLDQAQAKRTVPAGMPDLGAESSVDTVDPPEGTDR